MSERIDHAAQARRLLNIEVTGDNQAAVIAQCTVNTVGAQVHATLALAEQKRIENLMVLAGWVADARKEDVGYDLDKLRTGVAAEVWEGLGLS